MFKSKRSRLLASDINTPELSVEGKFKMCKVVDVYDGDTCKVVFSFKKTIYRWNVRMLGYNSPEMRISKSNPERDSIKARAIAARDYLKSLIQDQNEILYIKCGKYDKYGRVLGTLYLKKDSSKSVNDMMIAAGHGVPYP